MLATGSSPPRDTEENTVQSMIEKGLSEATLDVEVTLAETSITFNELRTLQVGDLLTTSKLSSEPVVVSVGGSPKFTGSIGHHRGNSAVKIEGNLRRVARRRERGALNPVFVGAFSPGNALDVRLSAVSSGIPLENSDCRGRKVHIEFVIRGRVSSFVSSSLFFVRKVQVST